jgi:hypothetical protein
MGLFLKNSTFQIKALFPLMQEAAEKMTGYIDHESKLPDFNGFDGKEVSLD